VKLQLPDSVSSPQDLKALVLDVHEYAKWFAHASIKKKVAGGQMPAQPDLSAAATELLQTWAAKGPMTQENLDGLLADLADFEAKAPQIAITLAAPPSNGIKKTLVAWCRKNIAADILVNFDFNSTLLGGMVVRYGSHVFDWSFRRKILEEHSKFPGVLRNV
jgi:hypothetical protein